MKFSERYGYVKPSDVIIRERITPEIQNAICNCYEDLEDDLRLISSINENLYNELEKYIWTYFLNSRKSEYEEFSPVCLQIIENSEFEWYEKMDLIQETILILRKQIPYFDIESNFINVINSEFKRLNFAYRIVEDYIVEITNKEAISSIETAIEANKNNVRLHLKNALMLFAKRPEADYRNSIKESISAVEALSREITSEKLLNFKKMQDKGLKIPNVLREAFEKLYGYTNDPKTGIRHSLMDETAEYVPGAEEALFMLVSCSAFINYLNSKKN